MSSVVEALTSIPFPKIPICTNTQELLQKDLQMQEKTADNNMRTKKVEEKDFPEEDIKLVMQQASCSRKDAVKALKEEDGDIVQAIMWLAVY